MSPVAATFLRFSRDRRGYEHFYLVQPTTNRRGKTRTRILYWFRTPPGVKVGRLPFDDEMRRAIEAQNPGVAFDWKKLLATPIPPPAPDVERWRERRRVERAERAARKIELAAEPEVDPEGDNDQPEAGAAGALGADDTSPAIGELEPQSATALPDAPEGPEGFEGQVAAAQPAGAQAASAPPHAAGKRRRRRRGGRRSQRPANSNPPTSDGGTKS